MTMKNGVTVTPMLDGGAWLHWRDFLVLARRLKIKLTRSQDVADDLSDNSKDKVFPFDEYPACAACGSVSSHEVLMAADGSRIVACSDCGLWFTSPRIKEDVWTKWLLKDSERNHEFTENRLRYGVALSRNIQLSFSCWWRILRHRKQKHIKNLLEMHKGEVAHIHDVGCGVGHFLKVCDEMGLNASGNDLNGYAVSRMHELFGFDVHVGQLKDLMEQGFLSENKYDIVHMSDFIEHSYHPNEEIELAYRMLKSGGLIYLSTFFVDSEKFSFLGDKWGMLAWNHVYHFSSESLSALVCKAGFNILKIQRHQSAGDIEIFAVKP